LSELNNIERLGYRYFLPGLAGSLPDQQLTFVPPKIDLL